MRELLKPSHTPETIEYGIKSFVYRRKRPFHPMRFYNFLIDLEDNAKDHLFSASIRSKGTVWLATRHLHSFSFHKAGGQIEFAPLDLWFAEVPQEKWGTTDEEIKEMKEFLKKSWSEPYGDRQQELVFIGIDMDQEKMEKVLDQLLLNDEEYELGPDIWTTDK